MDSRRGHKSPALRRRCPHFPAVYLNAIENGCGYFALWTPIKYLEPTILDSSRWIERLILPALELSLTYIWRVKEQLTQFEKYPVFFQNRVQIQQANSGVRVWIGKNMSNSPDC
jgi:hypothetical protein